MIQNLLFIYFIYCYLWLWQSTFLEYHHHYNMYPLKSKEQDMNCSDRILIVGAFKVEQPIHRLLRYYFMCYPSLSHLSTSSFIFLICVLSHLFPFFLFNQSVFFIDDSLNKSYYFFYLSFSLILFVLVVLVYILTSLKIPSGITRKQPFIGLELYCWSTRSL